MSQESDCRMSTNNNFLKVFWRHQRERAIEGSSCILEKGLGLGSCAWMCRGGKGLSRSLNWNKCPTNWPACGRCV